MLSEIQHFFEKSYRMAHCQEGIATASVKELGMVVRELNNEFIEAATSAIKEDVTIPMKRFRLYSTFLENVLMNEVTPEESFLHLQISLCTGSLTEGLLQLFLLAYKHDFIEAHWKQWNGTDIDQLREMNENHLCTLVEQKTITGDQKKSLLELLKREYKIRKNGREIIVIMLDELIGFCKNQEVFTLTDRESIQNLESIRDCRNNIHIFTSKSIPSFETVIQNVRNYCLIVLELISRVNGVIEDYE